VSHPDPPIPIAIPYGTDTPPPSARIWAAAVLLFASLGLMVVGGCFLIGVMLVTTNGFTVAPKVWTLRHDLLLVVLYLLAFTCFASAAILFVRTAAGLYKVLTR